jgi:histidyl-tRNA synthetase
VHDALAELGLDGFRFLLNSRRVLAGLLEAFGVPPGLGPGVLITLDKLDKLPPAEVGAELAGRGLPAERGGPLIAALTAADAADQIRGALKGSEEGSAGLAEVDAVLSLVAGQVPEGRVGFAPQMVRGLSYYTGPIWEVAAAGGAGSLAGGGRYDHLIAQRGGPEVPATGGSLGVERILLMLGGAADRHTRLDVAVTVMGERYAVRSFAFAAAARAAGLRASVYLGTSARLGRQLKWASDAGARWALIYGPTEEEAGGVTVRDMTTGEQTAVPVTSLATFFDGLAAG